MAELNCGAEPSVYSQSLALMSSSALSSLEQSCSIVTLNGAQVFFKLEVQMFKVRISSARDRSTILLVKMKLVLSKLKSGSLNGFHVPVPISFFMKLTLSEMGEQAVERAGSVSVH